MGPEPRTRLRAACTTIAGLLPLSDMQEGQILHGRINLVEHQVDNNASYRDIKPQRQRKAGNFPVPHKICFQSSIERDPYKRNYYDRQDRVPTKTAKITR